ncbi:SO2930 family diheme c-type cytochrome [Pseudoduganella danionis]|uniref:SO2930 family diheme c-type cytochrome n=1 Tax=Pseudoduganella danionis TaxID=1890295 RepID=UPI0035B4684A
MRWQWKQGAVATALLGMAAGAALVLSGCTRSQPEVSFITEGNPAKLSDWHLMAVNSGRLNLNAGVVPYDLNTPLFTDYAQKLRTIWMPKGVSATYDAENTFNFPVGTIISKTFYYPKEAGGGKAVLATYDSSRNGGDRLDLAHVRLVETRLLVRRADGWIALPYVWNADQTDAVLARTGEQIPVEVLHEDQTRKPLTYVVPNVNQCAACHVADIKSRQFQPIGPKARHMNRDYSYDGVSSNQLSYLARMGYLTGLPQDPAKTAPRNANWRDSSQPLDARARAYLDINCAHCHNDKGAANTTALHLNMGAPANLHLGLCKPPVAAGAGTGGHTFGIYPGKPDDSIMVYRLNSAETGVMMPELGRGSVHREGVALIKEWIAAMKQGCDQP